VHDTGDIPATIAVVRDDGSQMVVGRIDARSPDLVLVDALARLQLAARRRGWTLQIRDAPDELRAFHEFLGLSGVVAVETRRQAELREQPRVEEVVKPADPSV